MTTTEDKDNAITYEYIQKIVEQIASDRKAVRDEAYYSLAERVEDLAESYIKLHEENASLQAIVDRQRDRIEQLSTLLWHPGVTYIKAYVGVSKKMLSKAVTYNQQKESDDILNDIINEANDYIKEIKKALALTTTDTEDAE
jgi:hypothetical protein